jgi:hypothetical protein
MHDLQWSAGAWLAEFGNAGELERAVTTLKDKGYSRMETWSPVPLSGLHLHERTRIPFVVFGAGLLGAIVSYLIQWYANVHAYVQNIGGRPAHAVAAFLIPTFEGAVLSASLAAFVCFFVAARLPQPWHPLFEIPDFDRTSVDRYWLAVSARDHRSQRDLTVRELRALKPLRVLELEASA